MKNNYFKGFTLVELIIVITILAILSIISFLSFQSYTKNTRDSNRLTSIRNIENTLNIIQTVYQIYPEPDDFISIIGTGNEMIGKQGFVGYNVSSLLKLNSTPKDPLDGNKFLFSINSKQNKYQLLGFFENNENISFSILNETYALDNYSRIPKVFGNTMGIFLDQSNNPITNNITSTGNTQMKIILSNKLQISGTGEVLKKIKSTYKFGAINWAYYDPNCDLDDVIIGNQIWAGCNSTLGSGVEWGQLDSDIGTNNYSGTILGCYQNYNGINNISNCIVGSESMKSTSKAKSWFSGKSIYWDVEYDAIWGKFYSWTGAIESACPSGRHLPSDLEWTSLENYLYGVTCRTKNDWECNGLGWKRNGGKPTKNIAELLKIPLSGFRDNNNFYERGYRTGLWTSTDNNSTSYARNINYDNDGIYRSSYSKNSGGIVRCIKN